jgi:type IV fimbrial biogenesis protein FimT
LSETGSNWIVSIADPTGKCDVAPDPAGTIAPQTIQKRSGREGTPNVQINAVDNASTPAAATTVVFNGLGRLTTPGGTANIATIDIASSTSGAVCQHVSSAGKMRCLRITVSGGGSTKLCDPAVSATTDPRHC